jgi:hypothetical protein
MFGLFAPFVDLWDRWFQRKVNAEIARREQERADLEKLRPMVEPWLREREQREAKSRPPEPPDPSAGA